ncbi:hypothetical protein ACFSYG_18930 [Leeuwenhoekiella polynyae]|nr:hypothetical protein [Leeuwenhoekiella polynyae]
MALLDSTNIRFTIKEVMDIASRFFLIQISPNTEDYQIRVCRGINGIDKKSKKDYTILEAVLFDTIYNRVIDDSKDVPKFMSSLYQYLKFISATENDLEIIKNYVFSSMETDKNLQEFVFNYLEKNKNNVPFKIE